MPSPPQILAELHTIANQAQTLATLWHILALMALIGLICGWRPSRRFVASALVLPVSSVAVMAWIHGNPFNGVIFTVLALTLSILGLRLPEDATCRPPRWALALGLAMVAFGIGYPHFLDAGSLLGYLYAAPTGLIPCPTLAFVIGVALVVDGLGSRAWALLLAGAGLFYGVFGVARLGVTLDVGLIVGAVGLLARGVKLRAAP